MVARVSNLLHKLSTGWVTILFLIIFLVFLGVILPGQAEKAEQISGGAGSPDLSLFYTPGDLYKMAEVYGEEGRGAYIRSRFTFDLLFPLVYTSFLVTTISYVLKRGFDSDSRWQLANLVPVTGMVLDFLENISTSIVMARYPVRTPVLDWCAPVLTLAKWIFVGGSFGLLLVGVFAVLSKWFARQSD